MDNFFSPGLSVYFGAFKSRIEILPALFISLLTSKLWSDVISFAGTLKAQREKFALPMGGIS